LNFLRHRYAFKEWRDSCALRRRPAKPFPQTTPFEAERGRELVRWWIGAMVQPFNPIEGSVCTMCTGRSKKIQCQTTWAALNRTSPQRQRQADAWRDRDPVR